MTTVEGWEKENLLLQKFLQRVAEVNTMKNVKSRILFLFLVVLLTACTQRQFSAVYTDMTFDERIAQANSAIAGKVLQISPTLWNQDSGQYWESDQTTALPYFTIEIAVDRVIFADEPLKETLTVTVIGQSPVGSLDADNDIQAEQSVNLQVGDEVVVLAQKTEMAWRDGSRPIWQLMGLPSESYLQKGADGLFYLAGVVQGSLEQVIEQVATKRAS